MLRPRFQFQIFRFYSSTVKKFTSSHEWIVADQQTKKATIGITNYAQQELGDVVYVDLPSIGSELNAKESIGAVESVKAASDIYTPVDVTVTEINESLNTDPQLINSSAEKDGWIAKVYLKDVGQLDELMNSESYEKYLKGL